MVKTKTDLSFIHRFMLPKKEPGYERAKKRATEGKAFTTFLLLHGTGEMKKI